jgi:hypothetical protein
MKSFRFVGSFTVFVSAVFIVALAAQSNSVDHASPAPVVTSNLSPSAQKPPVDFARAVTYKSGGFQAASVAIADLNGDGKPDLVVANECVDFPINCAGIVGVMLGNGDGTFQPAVTYSSGGGAADSVAVADVNGDGKADLVVANCSNVDGCDSGYGVVAVLLGNGDGTFQPAVTYYSGGAEPISVAVADLNGDGKSDLLVANFESDTVGVLLGNGDGTFGPAVTYAAGGEADSVAVADVNGDGIPDLVVAIDCFSSCNTGGVSVLLGNGDGTFQEAVTYSSGGAFANFVAIADVNGDGKPDVLVANVGDAGGSVAVLLGNGDGTFRSAVTYKSGGEYAYSISVADVNGDGNPDLIVANECGSDCTRGSVAVLLGIGDGTFQSAVVYKSGGQYSYSVAVADVNGDNRPDVVVANACNSAKKCTSGIAGVLLNLFTAATTTTVTSSLNPSQIGQSVTFTATITASSSVPNGSTVTFYEGTTEIGTKKTKNGVASLTTSFPTEGKYTIKANYSGDAFHKASSGTVKQVVQH